MKHLKELGIGAFRPGSDGSGQHLPGIGHGSPRSDADSFYSRSSQRIFPKDYFEDEEVEDEDDMILECRVHINGKYKLVETLEKLEEYPDYANDFEIALNKINRASRTRADKAANAGDEPLTEDDRDDPIDEFSGAVAGGGGPAVPVGYTAKGKPETPAQRRKRYNFNINKSYPYTSLAKPPRLGKKRRKKKK